MANEPAAPAAPANPEPAAPASPPASTAAAAPATPAAAAGAPESTPAPSLLAGADAGKHEGAKPATDAKPPVVAEGKPADQASAAKPADGTPPPEGAKKDDAPVDAAKPDVKPDAKPDGAPDAAAKEALADTPPAPPVYDAYKLPEGTKLDDAKVGEFNTILGKFETDAKVDHAQVQALGQQLVDFYNGEVKRIGEQVAKHQVDVWNRMKEGWINDLKADPELGGNRIDTTLGNAKYAYENYLGLNKQQQDALMTVLDNAGVSSHPLLVRALHGLYQRFREPEPVPSNPLITSSKGKEPGNRGWYSAIDNVSQP
jgi:hypothetical protein